LVVSRRDQELVRAVWSLGWSTATTLAGLVSPGTQPRTLRRRLGLLVQERFLRQIRLCRGREGHVWVYETGPRAGRLAEAFRQVWRPPAIQLEHTLAVGNALLQLTQPDRFPGITILGWQGEAELRAWAKPGDPYPDAAVFWAADEERGCWWIELDRATETAKTWRRKMLRYFLAPASKRTQLPLAVTTSRRRAVRLAGVANELGQPLLVTTMADLAAGGDPPVYDARTTAVLVPLSQASVRESALGTTRT
jgi:hypothetical protein